MTDARGSAESRNCIKCGREVGPDESICQLCNRAGMIAPSASQYHGTVAVAIVLAVAALAVAASLSLRGVGPYAASVVGVEAANPGYTISYAVMNEGTNPGRAKCQLVALDDAGRRMRTQGTVTRQIPGGTSSELAVTIPGLEARPATVTITCS